MQPFLVRKIANDNALPKPFPGQILTTHTKTHNLLMTLTCTAWQSGFSNPPTFFSRGVCMCSSSRVVKLFFNFPAAPSALLRIFTQPRKKSSNCCSQDLFTRCFTFSARFHWASVRLSAFVSRSAPDSTQTREKLHT